MSDSNNIYYVIRNKTTGFYFRGKGVNRWGKSFNQASIFSVKECAEIVVQKVSWRADEFAEIVKIKIEEEDND